VTTDAYDRAGRLVSETDPLGHATSYAYDAEGNRLSVTDANSHVTSYAYDSLGRVTSVTAPDDGVTTYTYDLAGNMLTRTDANGHRTSYTYDADNRNASVTAPLGRVWTYAYDEVGNQTVTVDANGNATQTVGDGTTTRSYDANSRLTAIVYSDSTPTVSFTYDAVGNRLSMTDGAGTASYTYDAVDRLTQVSRGSDSFSYGYDAAGELTSRTYPDGAVVTNNYDADSRLSSVTSGSAITSYGYDAAGQLTTTTAPASNGYVETRTYDAAGRVIDVANTKGVSVLSDFAYTLDPDGSPTRIVRAGSLNETSTYSYDSNDRLTSICYQETCPNVDDPYIRYTYDDVGNRLTQATPSGTTAYSYNDADELTQAGSTSYSYDANGNELSAGARTFSYDLANRVAATTSNGETTSYSFDGDGNRLRAATGLATTNYIWDTNNALPELTLERDGSGTPLRRYVYGVRRISMNDGSGEFYYQYDKLGSVVNVTSSTGASEWTYDYDPFGGIRSETSAPQAPPNPMKYVGELIDPSGLYYLRARQYDPETGRFLARDPLTMGTEKPAISSYVYADDRPSVLLDPSGQMPAMGDGGGVIQPMPDVPASPAPVVTPLDPPPGGRRIPQCTFTPTNFPHAKQRIEYSYNFFRSKGLAPVQCAAIIGNFWAETTVRPLSPGLGELSGGGGIGIAQWTAAPRKTGLKLFAKNHDCPWQNLRLQLAFAWKKELNGTHRFALTNLRAYRSPAEIVSATTQFKNDYEGREVGRLPTRICYARAVLRGVFNPAGTNCPD
jgi:RHS repeat-associated protein